MDTVRWDKHDIKAAIYRRGTTLSKLATDHGLSASACSLTFLRPCPRADRVISAFIGVPLHELWPCRYDAEGNRLRTRHSTSIRRRRKSQHAGPVTCVTVAPRARASHHAA